MPRIAAAVTVVIVMGMCISFNAVRYPTVWKMVAEAHQPPRPEKPAPELQSPGFAGPEPAREPAPPIAVIADSTGTQFGSAAVDPIPFPAVLNRTDDESKEATPFSTKIAASMPDAPGRSLAWEDPGDSYESGASQYGTSGYGEQETGPVEASPSMKYASDTADPGVPDRSTSIDDRMSSDQVTRAETSRIQASVTGPPRIGHADVNNDRLAAANRRPLVPVAPANRPQHMGTTAGVNGSAEFGAGSRRTERLDHRVQRLPPLDLTWEPPHRTIESTSIDGPIPIYPSTQDHY